MRTIYLIRHGRTAANEQRLYCGSSDLPLSPDGAAAICVRRSAGGYPNPEGLRFFTSGMRRTEETLFRLYGDVPHQAIPDLREMDFGRFELHSYAELKDTPDYQAWLAGDNDENRCPDGESGRLMTERVLRAFFRLPASGDLLLVLHGGPIAAILAHLFPTENRNRYEWQPDGGCGWAVTLDGFLPIAYRAIP